MIKLSVNVNKIATIRNARGNNVPNLLNVALDIEKFGAEGITVHPRPDERHIRYSDVYDLSKRITTEFNIEGYPNQKFIDLVLEVKPHQVTLVPDPPHVLTSNAGWKIKENKELLNEVLAEFSKAGIRTALFMEPLVFDVEQVEFVNVDRIELYTEAYASNYANKENAIKPFIESALIASKLGVGINAGHDLSLDNLAYFKQNIPNLLEVSIGHALISDSLYFGLEKTIELYLKELE
ncbi:MAG: pyridoxine 5'-phosphate synthase [Flavobacteriales bacterium]|tara:strand:+ start:1815 stop:2525 length:711 start_codon:yes stop_codon:yes gene_type:complete